METYPLELRLRVLALKDAGMGSVEIEEDLDVSRSWVDSLVRLRESGASLEPKSRANKRQSLAKRKGEAIRSAVAANAGTTLVELKATLKLEDSIATISRAMKELGLSLKKSPAGPPSRTVPTSPSSGPSGRSPRPASTRNAWFSSTKPSGPRR